MNFPKETIRKAEFPAPMSAGERRLRALFQDSDKIFWVTNAHGLPLPEECGSWLHYTGQSVAELTADWTLALHPEDRQATAEAWQLAVKNQSPFRAEYRLRRHDGVFCHFLTHGAPLRDPDGKILEWVGTCTDISDRKAVEETMQRSARTSELLRKSILALNASQDLDSALRTLLSQVISVAEMDAGSVYVIEHGEARLRHQHGLAADYVVQVANQPLTTDYIRHALSNPDDLFDVLKHFPNQQSIAAKHGLRHVYCIPLLSDKAPLGFISVASRREVPPQSSDLELVRILTWETEALLTRLSADQRYRSMLTAMAEGMVVQLANGTITDCNPSAERILGLSRDQIMGRSSLDPRWRAIRENGELFPGEEHPAMVSLRTGKACHNVVMGIHLPDRTQRWLNINSEPVFHSGQNTPYAVVTTFDDITQRMQMIQSLQQSEGQLRHVGDNLPNGMMYQLLSHPDGRRQFLYVSAGVEKLHGITAAMALADAALLYQQIVEEDRPYVAAKEAECSQTMSPFSAQVRFRKPNGEVRWMQLSSAPTALPDGGRMWDGLEIDITEAKRMEEHLRQTQKMEGIGHLAGGIAHEFNNILAALMPGLAMLRDHATSPEALDTVQQLQHQTQRAAGLVKQMLAFSRQSVLNREPYDLAADIPAQIKLLRRLLGERIHVELAIPNGLPWVNADKNLIAQVLLTLCVNARDAMRGAGQLRISLETASADAAAVKAMPNVQAGEFLCLSITDSGCGMDRRILDRLFEPFFSTKPVGEGTGLGLATAQGIVQQHHGWLKVESLLGVGTTFRIYLPATAPVKSAPEKLRQKMTTGQGTILVVDDDRAVRTANCRLLKLMGYEVLEAADGEAAQHVWQQHHEAIDLLFTDMVMPGELTGLQLAELILKDKPSLQVIITSGYNHEFFDFPKVGESKFIYLPKPCESATLTKIISECLHSRA